MLATSNTFRVALEPEIAATVDLLAQMLCANQSENSDSDYDTEPLRLVAEQLGRVGNAAGEQGLFGLYDVCALFEAGLTEIVDQQRPFAAEEIDLLLELPERLVEYLDAPVEAATGRALTELLSRPAWIQQITDDEAAVLGELLVLPPDESDLSSEESAQVDSMRASPEDGLPPPAQVLDTAPTQQVGDFEAGGPAAQGAVDLAWTPGVTDDEVYDDAEDLDEAQASVEGEALSADLAWKPDVTDDEVYDDAEGLDEAQAAVEGEALSADLAWTPDVTDDEVYDDAEGLDEAQAAVEDEALSLEETVASTTESAGASPPLTGFVSNVVESSGFADFSETLEDKEASPAADHGDFYADAVPAALTGTTADSEQGAIHCAPPSDDLFDGAAEIPELPYDEGPNCSEAPDADGFFAEPPLQEDFDAGTAPLPSANRELVTLLEAEVQETQPTFAELLTATTTEERKSLLEALAEVMARMAEAAEAVEMPGLGLVCAHTASNLAIMAEDAAACDPNVMEAWPPLVLAYLGAPEDLERCRELVAYLQLPDWPYGLPGELAEELEESLRTNLSDATLEPVEQRQTRATEDDVSLAVPDDVNQELLESLLLELPTLTAEFSATTYRLNQGDGDPEDLTTAQRAAHTLKGAANTVGVVGIATLAHHIEDILQEAATQGEFPVGPLGDCLIEASDCLEAMAEALLGLGEAPAEARSVLQRILDWANWIDKNGLPDGQVSVPAAPSFAGPEERDAEAENIESTPHSAESRRPKSPESQVAPNPAVRTAASLADELLRLSGEQNILHGQLTNRLDRARHDFDAWQEHGSLLQQLAIELEQMVDIRGITWAKSKGSSAGDFDPLEMDQYNELHTLSRRLMEAASDAREFGHEVNAHFASMNALFVAQSRLQRDNEETVLRTRMVPASTVVARLQRSVRQTCRVAKKHAELQVIGADTLIDSEVLNALLDPLMHLLRNAVDHGIESPADRIAGGKPETGLVTLEFGRSGNHIMIQCRDDGAGLDFGAIRRRAEQHELIRPGQVLGDDDLSRLVFRPGFSTRDVASQVSGRGIGMDAVYHGVQKLKGSLQMRSESGTGLEVELLLPASLLSSHGVLAQVGEQVVAISSRGIEQILPPGAGESGRLGDFATYKVAEEIYEAVHLKTLLYAEPSGDTQAAHPVLLVRDSAGAVRAVLVDALLESRTLVVKSMGDYIPVLPGIAGATILGDGSVAPVVDLEALLQEPVVEPLSTVSPISGRSSPPKTQQPRALVVDDSLSARRSMTQFLEDAGYEVHTALDGIDAVDALQKELPDVAMVDLEMPRMNGLELTRHIRGNAATQHLPVIMVTSRSTGKHRREADVAGVNAYVNKPYDEDELLSLLDELIALRGAA